MDGQSAREYFDELDKARLRAKIAEERAEAFRVDAMLAAIDSQHVQRKCFQLQEENDRLRAVMSQTN